jgi:hypothetical protein
MMMMRKPIHSAACKKYIKDTAMLLKFDPHGLPSNGKWNDSASHTLPSDPTWPPLTS